MLHALLLLAAVASADDARPEPPPGPPPRAREARGERDRPPRPELDAMSAQEAWELSRIEHSLPDPNVALNQSLIVGFGAGHFYAGQRQRGLIFAGIQLVGAGIAGAAAVKEANSSVYSEYTYAPLMWVGLGIAGAARLADAYTAPYSAHLSADEALQYPR
jgi:hypothetical protein